MLHEKTKFPVCCSWLTKDCSNVDPDQQMKLAGFKAKGGKAMTMGLAKPSGSSWQPSLRCLQHGENGKTVISGVGYHFEGISTSFPK